MSENVPSGYKSLIFFAIRSGKTELKYTRSVSKHLKALRTGKAQMVFMWWELQMDINAQHILSCAPYWAHPANTGNLTSSDIPWRDHWMQALYYLPQEMSVIEGQKVWTFFRKWFFKVFTLYLRRFI